MTILIIATTPYTLKTLWKSYNANFARHALSSVRFVYSSQAPSPPHYTNFIAIGSGGRVILGEGSFAKVYLVKNKATKNLVCSKVMKLRNMKADEQKACWNEVELMKRMAHPNMVSYFDSFLYRNCLCIIMEFCDAGDVGTRIQNANGVLFPERKILLWFVQLALAVHYMHRQSILHRDIKTQNVFILSSGRVVLGDFGISKLLEGDTDFTSTCVGTPYYMSPEIFQNKKYNHKSDIWALGCILYELATLKHAFDAKNLCGLACKITTGRYPPVSGIYTRELRSLIRDLLSRNPNQRPDIEQVMRRPFMKKYISIVVTDVHDRSDSLHNSQEAINSMNAQLKHFGMEDLVMDIENDANDECELELRSLEGQISSLSSIQMARSSTHSSSRKPSTQGSSQSSKLSLLVHPTDVDYQNHQLELEEERRIASEMALERLRQKAEVRRERNGVSPKLPLETPSNGHCKSHTQEWQRNIDSCTVTASTSRDPLLESGPNQSPKTGKGTENTTDPSNSTGHYPVGSNEKEFMEYLLAQAIQHETEDDSDYQIVRSRERELEDSIQDARQRCSMLQEEILHTKSSIRYPQEENNDNPILPNGNKQGSNVATNAEISVPPRSSTLNVQDAPTSVAKLQSRFEDLKRRCTDTVGVDRFNQAFTMLRNMMDETDGFVELDGQIYDGADEEQVKVVLTNVLGEENLHLCSYLDKLVMLDTGIKLQ